MSRVIDGNIPSFQYKVKDFNFVVNKNNEVGSALDSLLTRRWEEAQKNGIFKYVLNIKRQKTLEGKHGFLAQLNPDRGEKRRKPEDISSMSQPFDPNLFNFTKISNQEILFDIENGNGNDIVAANISPIEVYHSLLITERFECHPQRVTKYSLKRAIDLLLLSNSPVYGRVFVSDCVGAYVSAKEDTDKDSVFLKNMPDLIRYLRIIFNSLCAHASVNHLHWHLYYLKHHMPLESINVDRLRGPIFVLMDYPAKGFCLRLSSFPDRNINTFISWTYFILEYLQTSDIAHNIYITRAKENAQSHIYDDIRVYIWARKSSSGVKSTCDFIPAVCELFGHLSIKSEEGYEDLTEDIVAEILNDITSDSFYAVRDNILAMNLDEKGLIIDQY